MSNLSIFVKLTEKETEELKQKILKDKNLLKENDIGGSSLLQIVIAHGNVNLAKFLINNGIDVNHKDEKGGTALHYCATYNQYDIAKYILEHNGRLDIADKYGNEPLWVAAHFDKGMNERIEIITLFLKFGANKEHVNNAGKMPIDIANRYKSLTDIFNSSII